MRFELFVAKRYLNSKRKGLFALITTIIGIAGVTVGVAALITTLAVMTGFQTDIKEKVIGAQSHILIFGHMTEAVYQDKIKKIEQLPLVYAAAPNIFGQGIITHNGSSLAIVLRGLEPEMEDKVNRLNSSFEEGSYVAPLREGETSAPAPLVLGTELANSLNLEVGDDVVLISPSSISTSAGMVPKMKKFRISGTIKTGYYEFDRTMGYTTLEHASEFLNLQKGATGISIRLKNIDNAEKAAKLIRPIMGNGFSIRTFAQLNGTLYAALKLEKTMMFIILSLIILVASLNIASNLILLGTEKLKDIGILRAMGASPASIRKIFIYEGLMIGTAGIVCGVILAMILCWIIATFNIVQLPGDIYYLTKVPVRISLTDILSVVAGSYLLCFLAAVYPAVRASKVNPTDAIRYG
ncbi:Putative lipoprotein releasing system [Elusimicrobium minutum Pei191]|uniref:Putative lipoprotein releasing system n=1 Tax=Elusimicrobium minutum (strain Pei191) TaxID=445932 RepID=B2KEB4_ELUMP|nr:FtsX-like permease family protein [Elusimicrobium minutum]ACC98860.1 Putative lipoprotein releasing system [Elusimicrobium minutum Pei191]